jgi:hypothetical protein
MANDLQELISRNPELLKQAVLNPEATKRVLAMINGMIAWCKMKGIPLKQLRITGPGKSVDGYDGVYHLTRKK